MSQGWRAVVAADDGEFWLAICREAGEFAGRLLPVRSGRDCLRAIEDPRVRLVVLDSSLRDATGAHLVHLVRRIRPDLGIAVTFDRSDLEQEREARQAGILYYGDRRGVREIAAVLRKSMTASVPANGAAAAVDGVDEAGRSGGEDDRSPAPGGVGERAAAPIDRPKAGNPG